MNQHHDNAFTTHIVWSQSEDPTYPYYANVQGTCWKIKINSDFPEEDLYTLIIGKQQLTFNDWPEKWQR